MYPVVGQCPVCGGELVVTRLQCLDCATAIEGQFTLGPLVKFTPEQWKFIEVFIRCEGKINRVEKELDVSYPTVRARLDDVILALGYTLDEEDIEAEAEEAAVSEEERRRILDDLAAGRISSETAVMQLRSRPKE
ncbi:MAG: DUF2089 domain-containing protein [Anaerolineae bacterium]|nr:DUF2089 domain-containing protein [Anaerolineae bacterium]